MQLTIPPGSNRPLPAEVQEALERLRAESDHSDDPKSKALLLHELGVVAEIGGDDHAAARDLLQAINSDTALREPLEHLAFLLERRGSFKNLPRLLERMVRVASNDEERARALEALGDFAADVSGEFEAARHAYDSARDLEAQGVRLELARQLVAEEQGDKELALACLVERAERAEHETYAAALWVCAARRQLEMGEPAAAQASLERAAASQTPVRWTALVELERLARLCNDPRLGEQALRGQAELLDAASRDEVLRRKLAIDTGELGAARRADAWLRVARAADAASNREAAIRYALTARALLPGDLGVLHWLLERAELLTDLERSKLLGEELSGATDPDTIAALALLAARDASLRDDPEAALQALARCREHEPDGLVAQAHEYELLLGRTTPGPALAEALERLAERMPDGEARARYQVLAALAHAASSGEATGAVQASLSRAAVHTEGDALGRLGRMLAARSGDGKWFLEATQRVLKTARPEERLGLLLDLVRTSLAAGDDTAASFNLEEASDTPDGAWLAALLHAYTPPNPLQDTTRSERALRALGRLASLDGDLDRAFALRQLVASQRARLGRGGPQLKELEELHRERPANGAVALQLADLARNDAVLSANVLSNCAEHSDDLELQFILRVLAAVASFRAGQRERAIRELKRAHEIDGKVVAPLLSWALSSAHPNDLEERRLMLAAMQKSGRDGALYAIERFGLEAGMPAQRGEATRALDEAGTDDSTDLGQALMLARALWTPARDHHAAVAALESCGASGREIARALAFLDERRSDDASTENLATLAARWAASGSLVGALEWLGVAVCTGQTDEELRAREQIANELGASAAASLRAGALLIGWLGRESPELLAAETALSQLANLEVAPPGCDPRRRAHALATSESALPSEAGHTALVLAGYNHLFAGALRESLAAFHTALSLAPSDLGAWEGIRAVAEQLGNVRLEADALHKLAGLTRVAGRAAELERTRAELLGRAGDAEASQRALERAVELDVEHFDSFNKLFRRFRGEKRYDKVLELADRRLQVTNDSREVAKLCWERARAYRGLGNLEAALSDLDTVRVLDPNHPGPAALAGEIYVTQGDMAKAAEELAHLAAMDSAPEDQRLMSGVAAADLFDDKLGRPDEAVRVLEGLHDAGLGTLGTRERLAKNLAAVGRWEDAVQRLEELMNERESHAGRVQAARLALVICRDELNTPARALAACEKLLRDAPLDPEALDYLLAGKVEDETAFELLRAGRDSILTEPATGYDAERVTRLARIAERIGDRELRLSSLGLILCTDATCSEFADEADLLVSRTAAWPSARVPQSALHALFGDALDDPIGELCRLLAPFLSLVLEPNAKSLGLGRRDRLKAQAAPELFEQLSGWLEATGNTNIDVFAGGAHDQIVLLPTEKASLLVLGPTLKAPLSRDQQATLARRCLGVQAGVGFVDDRDPHEVAAVITAACALAEVDLPGPGAVVALTKALGKELPRRVRKQLPELARRIVAQNLDPHDWCRRVRRGLDRASVLALGDVSSVLLGRERRARGETVTGHFLEAEERRFADLSAFVTSTSFRNLRRELGLAHP